MLRVHDDKERVVSFGVELRRGAGGSYDAVKSANATDTSRAQALGRIGIEKCYVLSCW